MNYDEAKKHVSEHVEMYGSLGDFIETVEHRKVNPEWGSESSNEQRGDNSWFGGTTGYLDALTKAKHGCAESLKAMDAHRDAQMKNFTASEMNGDSVKTQIRNYYAGGSPNVTRAMMGLPRDMRQVHKASRKVKSIEIVYAVEFMSGTTAEEVAQWGGKVCAIVEALERDGYTVKLRVYGGTDPRGDCGEDSEISYIVTLKDYNEYLDMKKIAFVFANAGFYRRVGFRWIETYPYKKAGKLFGYGGNTYDTKQALHVISENEPFYFISREDLGISAKEWLDSKGLLH